MVAPADLSPRAFYALAKPAQADLVWEHLFVRRSPVSEAARGVLRTLELLGLDAGSRDLRKFRAHFVRQKLNAHLERIFKLARIDYAVMTNDIFSPRESLYFLRARPCRTACARPSVWTG